MPINSSFTVPVVSTYRARMVTGHFYKAPGTQCFESLGGGFCEDTLLFVDVCSHCFLQYCYLFRINPSENGMLSLMAPCRDE